MKAIAPPVHILCVAPRPGAVRPVPTRDGVEALFAAVEAQGDQATAEWLWPPRVEALQARLSSSQGPAVDALYLDTTVTWSDGHASLVFESLPPDATQWPDVRLLDLLKAHEIPVLILRGHAQANLATLQAWAEPYAVGGPAILLLDSRLDGPSLQRLLTGILAMWLADGTLGQAVEAIRQSDTVVRTRPYASESLVLSPADALRLVGGAELRVQREDRRDGVSKVVRFPSAELAPAWQRLPELPALGGLPREPVVGLVGRALEMGLLEHALRDEGRRGAIWLVGYEGLGKTALATHLARWLVRNGRFEQAVYTSFRGGGQAETAWQDLGARLLGKRLATDREDAIDAVVNALSQTPTLVIWDNLEQLLPGGDFALGDESLGKLWSAANRIAQAGPSRLILVSDALEVPSRIHANLSIATTLSVNPLPPEEALELWGLLAPKAGAATEHVRALVDHLGEHPLALEVAAEALRHETVEALTAELEALLSGFARGEARSRNQALEVTIERLVRTFAPDARVNLRNLGLLSVGSIEPLLLRVIKLRADEWAGYRERLVDAGLLILVQVEGMTVPYIRLHPALCRYMAHRLTDAQRAAAVDDYYYAYMGLLSWLHSVEPRAQAGAERMVRMELPNLRRTLLLLLEHDRLELALDYTGHLARFLERLGLTDERDAVRANTQQTIQQAITAEGPLPRYVVRFLIAQADRLLAGRGVYEAATVLQQLLERMGKEKALAYEGNEATLDRGMALRRLGRAMHLVGRLDVAAGAYAQALSALHELPSTEGAGEELMPLYEHLTEVLMLAGQVDAAQQITEQGIAFAQSAGDARYLGVMTAQMGSVLATKGDADGARRQFEEALTHLGGEQDRPQAATVWTQMGALADALEDRPEAERCYQRALELAEAAGHAMFQGQTLVRLARLAERDDRLAEARARYAEALRLFTAENARGQMVSVQLSLAEVALREGDLDQARVYAEAARALADKLVPGGTAWQPLVTLQRIAEAAGDEKRARDYRFRAQEAFAKSPDAADVLQRWGSLIRAVVASTKGEALDVDAVQALEGLETNEAWGQLAAKIWRILGGERGPELYADLDHVDALVIRTILQGIEAPEESEESSSPA